MRFPMMKSSLYAAALVGFVACGQTGQSEMLEGSESGMESFEEFRAHTWKEAGTGIFIVDGDTPIVGEEALRDFYNQLQSQKQRGVRRQGLAVATSGGLDVVWSAAQKRNLTYCVSTNFGSNYTAVKTAMAAAAAEWEAAAIQGVKFVHDTTQDATCTALNNNVVFDVNPVSGQSYLARAFFPNFNRLFRNMRINSTAFGSVWSLTGILRHELGHVLGFRHEHTRPEAGTCFEDNDFRAVTSYDSASVMHYPQCNGTQRGDLVLTDKDKAGAATVYADFAKTVAELNGRWFRLVNGALGGGQSLDSGVSSVFMGQTGAYSGQYWRITSLGGSYNRLNNLFQGAERSLDSSATSPHIAPTGNYSGQYWQLTPDASGCFRLTNMFQGTGRSMDLTGATPVIAPNSSASSQCWRPVLL